jgi:hypothetical protein
MTQANLWLGESRSTPTCPCYSGLTTHPGVDGIRRLEGEEGCVAATETSAPFPRVRVRQHKGVVESLQAMRVELADHSLRRGQMHRAAHFGNRRER